jgi:hypothetical protein
VAWAVGCGVGCGLWRGVGCGVAWAHAANRRLEALQ